jgi:hypothetical protein
MASGVLVGISPVHGLSPRSRHRSPVGLIMAGSKTLHSKLPDPCGADSAVVILRLRGRTTIGATFILVVEDYLRRLRDGGGQLFLSGVDTELYEQLGRRSIRRRGHAPGARRGRARDADPARVRPGLGPAARPEVAG